ncbi:MAG: hypothetical protein AAGC47_09985 [Bacteroidota bacterium]
MKDNLDLHDLWSAQTSKAPQLEELYSSFSSLKRKKLAQLIAVNSIMVATIVFIVLIWIYFDPNLITTKIGIILSIAAILIYSIAYSRMYPKLMEINEDQSNKEFLDSMIKVKAEQKFMQTRMLQFYFVTLTVGLCLYMIEFVSMMRAPWNFVAYGALFFWVAFNWFVLLPRVIKKQNAKLDDIIERLTEVNTQE